MELGNPEALLLLILAPLFLWHRRQRVAALPFAPLSSGVPLPFTSSAGRSRFIEVFPRYLRILAFLFLVIALARPQSVRAVRESEESGRDIMLTLDLSGSMQALDFFSEGRRVNRLTALKKVVKEFVSARRGDRIGLVVFGDKAFTMCPLTTDATAVENFIDRLELGMAGEGTGIGDGLSIALKSLRELKAKSQVVILVTDGKNNSGAISPLDAAKIAQSLGIKIHAVGIGGNEPVPIPVRDMFGRNVIVEQRLEYDEETLKEIAQTTGGEYFNAKDLSGLQNIYSQINSLERRTDKTFEAIEYDEYFQFFVALGAVVLICAVTLRVAVYRPVPFGGDINQ